MLHGVSLLSGDIPVRLHLAHALVEREYRRGPAAEPEVRFLAFEHPRVLPVWSEGRLIVAAWGSDDRRAKLPTAMWARQDSLEGGTWSPWEPQPVVIPCQRRVDRGRWFEVREGVRAVLVLDADAVPHVYPVVYPSTHYYKVMTGSDWEPALVDEVI